NPDAHARLAGRLERGHRLVLPSVGPRVETNVDEVAVVTVYRRPSRRLTVHRDQALAPLARRFGEELLEPDAERADAGRCHQRDLVAPASRENAQENPEEGARILRDANRRAASIGHRGGVSQEPRDVEP